ncbi:hypothetical protein ACFE04_029635 [Oxalis oulophora]
MFNPELAHKTSSRDLDTFDSDLAHTTSSWVLDIFDLGLAHLDHPSLSGKLVAKLTSSLTRGTHFKRPTKVKSYPAYSLNTYRDKGRLDALDISEYRTREADFESHPSSTSSRVLDIFDPNLTTPSLFGQLANSQWQQQSCSACRLSVLPETHILISRGKGFQLNSVWS